jgi:SAM-dependent methyltransferase
VLGIFEMNIISKMINDQFWNIAFRTGMYDFLMMSSYDHSLKTIANSAKIEEGWKVMDVGCGSGRLLFHLSNKLKDTGSQWTGLELTPGGISACKYRIRNMGLEDIANVLPANMCQPLPLDNDSMDVAIAHFSMYVIPDRNKRIEAFKNIASALKEGGRVYLAAPGKNYNAKDQVNSSIAIDKENAEMSGLKRGLNKLLFSTFGYWSEKAITKRIQDGVWSSFSKEELESEAREAGLKLEWVKGVYGETSLMASFSK